MPILNKRAGEEASELEKKIESAMKELLVMKNATEDQYLYRSLLKGLYFVGAQEFELKDDSAIKSCIVIHVPVPQLREWRRAQTKVVREMEAKMFSGSHVVVIAKRRILPKPLRGKSRRPQKQKRPRNRTLTAVHEETLNDLVYPAEVVGRRIRYKTDGKQVLKVHLDKLHKNYVEHKVDTFKSVYKKITNKSVEFEFPDPVF